MKILHLNIRSLFANLAQFRAHIYDSEYDVICLSETWLTDSITDVAIQLNNHQLYRNDRIGRGGGLAIYVKNIYNSLKINNLPLNLTEQLWIKIYQRNSEIAIGVVYRPPRQPQNIFLHEFDECIGNIFTMFDSIVCCGDFNIDMLKPHCATYEHFSNVLESYGLSQVVEKPTRISHTTSSLLDLFLCSDSIKIENCEVLENSDIASDHNLVILTVANNTIHIQEIKLNVRNLKKINGNNFNEDLLKSPLWDAMLYLNDMDIKLNIFNNILISLFDKYAPLKVIETNSQKPHKPWLTENLKFLMKLRDKALHRFKKQRTMLTFNITNNYVIIPTLLLNMKKEPT